MSLRDRPCFYLNGQPFAVLELVPGLNLHPARHCHEEAQIFCLRSGLAVIENERGRWAVPPGQLAWVPPYVWHIAEAHGETAGWSAYPPPDMCDGLPEEPCVLEASSLAPLIMERALTWPRSGALSPEKARLMEVFMDEVRLAAIVPARLPFPVQAGLVRVTSAILAAPGERRGLEYWAKLAAMSERSLSRHFRQETGMSLHAWQQSARLHKAREILAEGASVQDCAWDLGYESVSAFIAAFKRMFGQTPSRFRDG